MPTMSSQLLSLGTLGLGRSASGLFVNPSIQKALQVCGFPKVVRQLSSYRGSNSDTDTSSNCTETHGQPLHKFGSSIQLEHSAIRFDTDPYESGRAVNEYRSQSHQDSNNTDCHSDSQSDVFDEHVDVYNHDTSVNLSACMQSQVPEPYGKTPTHLNMPGGLVRREHKYIQGHLSNMINKREYSTVSGLKFSKAQSLDEHGSPTFRPVEDIMVAPCPQGIQGEDCAQFKLWLSNCLKFGDNIDCERLANEYIAGRKTLPQIFAEYEVEIKKAIGQGTRQNRQVGSEHILMSSSQPFGVRNVRAMSSDSSTNSNSSYNNGSTKSPKQGRRDRLKAAVRDYGSTVIVFHITISLASLGFFYTLIASNVDIVSVLEYFNITGIISSSTAETASTFAVAYAVHKVFAPVRIGITLTCAPLIVRALRARGILKVK